MNKLGEVYMQMEALDLSENYFLQCYETRKSILGDQSPDTLTSMNNLAYLYDIQG